MDLSERYSDDETHSLTFSLYCTSRSFVTSSSSQRSALIFCTMSCFAARLSCMRSLACGTIRPAVDQ